MHTISKSDFLIFNECSSLFWFFKYHKERLAIHSPIPFEEQRKQQGQEAELYARNLFIGGVLVQNHEISAVNLTTALIKSNTEVIFQAAFKYNDLMAITDIIIWNSEYQAWDLFEVKGSSSRRVKKKTHLIDATFQKIVIEGSGLKLSNIYLIELNKEYIRRGEIQVDELFQISEITTEVLDLEDHVRHEIVEAREFLKKPEPNSCECRYKGRSKHCPAFLYLYPDVPEYSVYDLVGIGNSKAKLKALVDEGVIDIKDIRDDHDLTTRHRNQWRVHITQEPIIRYEKIKKELEKLVYPIYFLDYETHSSAIPKYDYTYPYQQVVFQYSIHVVYENGDVEHKEFLHKSNETPMHIVSMRLREDIGDEGSVVVWNKTFESSCNKDLASMNSGNEEFLLSLNHRMFDLMNIFRKQYYLHDDFKGSYSIKKVLPVLCPELNYEELNISEGGTASIKYEEAIFGNISENDRKKIFNDLLKYCHLDTWAMVRIWEELKKLIK